jgi:hypothetical protein
METPGNAGRFACRLPCTPVMLALVASIHVLNTAFDQRSEDVDGRDKPDHDGYGGFNG